MLGSGVGPCSQGYATLGLESYPGPGELPWAQRELPWAQRELPWARRELPWARRELPWARRELPWARRELPWARRELPWARRATTVLESYLGTDARVRPRALQPGLLYPGPRELPWR
ncbi:hypothetical protein NDU88_000879 [Pleurodeles waltl]|uniref:Uncharacterized protein n=1 Tax=Pleurodeles waltl TaxID=8319 RepID=A0AAV7NHE9_PLEWA|nr:hypothetical protein NDU88_000879 [Pleurodeles waltl]